MTLTNKLLIGAMAGLLSFGCSAKNIKTHEVTPANSEKIYDIAGTVNIRGKPTRYQVIIGGNSTDITFPQGVKLGDTTLVSMDNDYENTRSWNGDFGNDSRDECFIVFPESERAWRSWNPYPKGYAIPENVRDVYKVVQKDLNRLPWYWDLVR
ncbi:hypothetical protein HY212_05035 [Candidatus Pacearchaeota archaeon]|nr:hypothetical protein [Candidatus Pacearchaeota archaeon]